MTLNFSTIMGIIFRDILIFYQVFFLPHGKRSVIISNKYVIYELPHELPYNLRLRILGTSEGFFFGVMRNKLQLLNI